MWRFQWLRQWLTLCWVRRRWNWFWSFWLWWKRSRGYGGYFSINWLLRACRLYRNIRRYRRWISWWNPLYFWNWLWRSWIWWWMWQCRVLLWTTFCMRILWRILHVLRQWCWPIGGIDLCYWRRLRTEWIWSDILWNTHDEWCTSWRYLPLLHRSYSLQHWCYRWWCHKHNYMRC